MKTYSSHERTANIFSKAVALGFEFEPLEDIRENESAAIEFLIENAEKTEEFCPVKSNGRSQYVSYADRMGYEYQCDGDILTYDKFAAPDHKYFHSTIVNSLGDVVELYDMQGENEFNTEAE